VKRAPIVIAGTLAGLIVVLEFHTTPAKLSIGSGSTLPVASAGSASTGGGASASASPATTAGPSSTVPSSAGKKARSRTAVGPGVNYNFGVVSVRVTVSGGKIVKIGIASLQDDGNPRSQFIDQQALPILEQEALQAQSANIQGVSGASYTSAGFTQSLQSALHSLGM
jgi:uncharacterized protein with FMN-binding domain